MKKLTDSEILNIYNLIKDYHFKYLEKHGVKLPNLKSKKNEYTKDALVLVYLTKNYPNTEIVSKKELTEFLRIYFDDITDVQQGRHLSTQQGWYILSGKRNDISKIHLLPGEYKLLTLQKSYPGFSKQRRDKKINEDYWNTLKSQYDFKCACCGSEENKPHRYWKNTITILQKGHKNPNLPLEPGNIIPQCEKCNQPDRDYWIYDDKGRAINIANSKIIDKCSKEIQKEIYIKLYNIFGGKNPEDF